MTRTGVLTKRFNAFRWLALAALLLAPASHAAAPTASSEYEIKAAYLYKFGDFVEWPAKAFASPDSPATLCIVGDDPFDGILDKAVSGQRIGGRPIVVKRLQTVGADSGCHILYVDTKQPPEQYLAAVRGSSVLTVTDGALADQTGGIISFVIKDNRVRFEIDDQAAAVNGLSISSKLLSLAVAIKHRG